MSAPLTLCGQYEACSCPRCPLDPAVDTRDALPGEPTCTARRTTRERIAASYPAELLPWRGLLPRERRRDERRAAWAALPEDHPRKVALRKAQGLLGRKPGDFRPADASGEGSGAGAP